MTLLTEPVTEPKRAQPRSMKAHFDGTHRAQPPEATWRGIKPFFAQLGISRVAVVTGLDVVGIPVVMVTRPNARSLSVSQGKGVDLMSAKVSGAMESIEQHCAEHLDLPLRYTSHSELSRRHAAVSPTRLPCISNMDMSTRPLLWVEGYRCSDGSPCWLPHGLVHLDLRRPLAPGSELFPLSSNGLASGNSRSEALVHALLEVIERDAWARFGDLGEHERAQRRLDLSSVADARALELIGRMRDAGLTVVVWDLSGELGVACFLCQLVEQDTDWAFATGRAEGLGCHTDRGIALTRALCEAAQSRLCAIAGTRDDMTRASTSRIRAPQAVEWARRQLSVSTSNERNFSAVSTQSFQSFEEELAWLIGAIERHADAEVFAVDIPSLGLPISVARVLVAGARAPHFLSSQVPRPTYLVGAST